MMVKKKCLKKLWLLLAVIGIALIDWKIGLFMFSSSSHEVNNKRYLGDSSVAVFTEIYTEVYTNMVENMVELTELTNNRSEADVDLLKVRPIYSKNECSKTHFDFRDDTRMLMIPQTSVKADCSLLFSKKGLSYARSIRRTLKTWTPLFSDVQFMSELAANCSVTLLNFVNAFYVSNKEKEFPLAFEILVYYKPFRVQQYIRLLMNLYRPQNIYCLHIDGKAPDWWTNLLISFADCFPNIIIAKSRIKVNYGTARILYAHFRCFEELLDSRFDWKYVISLHGTELPLVTNREMVDILTQMNGTNLIQRGENSSLETSQSHPWIIYKVKSIDDGRKILLTNETLGPIPYNITIFKSAASANSAFSRRFISFIFSDERSVALSKFLKDVQSAVEMFFSTVNSFPNAPGGYHTLSTNSSNIPIVAMRDWVFQKKTFKKLCFGRKLVHNICIVSSADLYRLGEISKHRGWWFHNKYFFEYDHVVMNCMENLFDTKKTTRNIKLTAIIHNKFFCINYYNLWSGPREL